MRAGIDAASFSRAAPQKGWPSEIILRPQAEEKLDGERKTVTALFADIKRSMELMEDLDPEEARAIVDPALNTGRVTVSGDRFIETHEGDRTERLIQNETELRTLLAEHFGVTGIDRDLLPRRDAVARGLPL